MNTKDRVVYKLCVQLALVNIKWQEHQLLPIIISKAQILDRHDTCTLISCIFTINFFCKSTIELQIQ
jgi:hypothetical protein